jgi:hypothetical protein
MDPLLGGVGDGDAHERKPVRRSERLVLIGSETVKGSEHRQRRRLVGWEATQRLAIGGIHARNRIR